MIETSPKPNWMIRHREEIIGASIYLLVAFLDFIFRDFLSPVFGLSYEIAALTLLLLLVWMASRMLKKRRNRKDSIE